MNQRLFALVSLTLLYAIPGFTRDTWACEKYRLHGEIKAVTCYEYRDSVLYIQTIETFNIKGNPLTKKVTENHGSTFASVYAYEHHIKKTITSNLTKGTTMEVSRHYHSRHWVSESYWNIEWDNNRRFNGYRTQKYRHNREIAYSSYYPDSSLKCRCNYHYTKKTRSLPDRKCTGPSNENCDFAPISTRIWKTKKSEFDYDIPFDIHPEYSKDSLGHIVEAIHFDNSGQVDLHFKYSDFDERGNWRLKQKAPGSYVRLEIAYY